MTRPAVLPSKNLYAAAEKAIAAGKKTGQDVADTEALLKKINTLK